MWKLGGSVIRPADCTAASLSEVIKAHVGLFSFEWCSFGGFSLSVCFEDGIVIESAIDLESGVQILLE